MSVQAETQKLPGNSRKENDLQKDNTIYLKTPNIHFCNMSTDLKNLCLKIGEQTMTKMCKNEILQFKEAAQNIQQQIVQQYEGTWHVIVGDSFGSYVAFEKNHAIQFQINKVNFLIWKFC